MAVREADEPVADTDEEPAAGTLEDPPEDVLEDDVAAVAVVAAIGTGAGEPPDDPLIAS